MSIINELKGASYRGIPFFYQGSEETGGFKVAEHLYPGSDNFIIEQMGRIPRRFSIECRITFGNRDSFDIALNTPGLGILSHPMYGNFLVKVNGEFQKSDTKDELGLYTYSVPFSVEVGLITPTLETISLSKISELRAAVLDTSSAQLNTVYESLGIGNIL